MNVGASVIIECTPQCYIYIPSTCSDMWSAVLKRVLFAVRPLLGGSHISNAPANGKRYINIQENDEGLVNSQIAAANYPIVEPICAHTTSLFLTVNTGIEPFF